MKFLIPLTFLLTGCSNMQYNIPNYIGEVPFYVSHPTQHGEQCPCCLHLK